MNKWAITIELLAETIFGSGESKNGIVNMDVLVDQEGFPYYMGKTFKGCLNSVMKEILSPSYSNMDEITDGLFGQSQHEYPDEKSKESKEGKIRFSNFQLHPQIKELFAEDKASSIDTLTDIRQSIRMKDGVAEDGSLRSMRVLKKGLIFVGHMEADEDLTEEELKAIQKGIKGIKHLGIQKSRGKGLVKVSLEQKKPIDNDGHEMDENKIKNGQYIFYELYLNEPVKIGDSQSQDDYEQTKGYISGATVRGSIIGRYLNNGNSSEKDEFKELLKRVKFYDAYPIYKCNNEEKYTFPTPNVYRITKEKDKEKVKAFTRKDIKIVFERDQNKEDEKIVKLKKGEFSYYEDNTLYQFNVKKEYRFHHSIQMEKENIFRYEAIAPKQKFYGIIDISHVKGPLKKKIYDLLKKQRYIYLGGSRNTGYGKTLIENVEILEDLSKFDYLKQCESVEEHTYIYHLSDAILRDASHQISAGFHIGYLKKELELSNLEEREIESEINPVMITGYNQKWRCHNPHVYGVEKGSVVKINKEIKEIKANERFMKKQHGDRREDGLGRVIINPRFLEAKKICVLDENEREEVDCYEHYIKKDMDEAVIHRIKKDIKDHKIQRNMKSYIVKMLKKKDSNDRPYKNQIQNVIKVIDEVMIEKGNLFRQFKSKLENLEKITQNSNRNQKKNKVLTMEILKSGNHVYSLKKCMNLSQSEKTKIIQEIIKEDVENIDEIILKLIRNVLYYQTRKGEDDNDQ